MIDIAVIGRNPEVIRALRAAGFSVRRTIKGSVAAVHLAGPVAPIAAAMKEAGIWRLIHVSAGPGPGEEAVRATDLDWTIVRAPNGDGAKAVVAALQDLDTERRMVTAEELRL